MAPAAAIIRGREAFARQKWRKAYEQLSAADREAPLEPADLERLAAAAYLLGEDSEALAVWARAHRRLVDQGNAERAARCGFWLSLNLLLRGETARGTGWLARCERLLGDRGEACVEEGWGQVVTGLLEMAGATPGSAHARFEKAVALAERFGDPDLLVLGLLGSGQCLIQQHESGKGIARLDEAMVSVAAGEVSPVLAGIVYCAVVLTCRDIFDLRRAREWTGQFDDWCASQPDLVPFRGQCLVHRSEILQSQGDWPGALCEAMKARRHLRGRSEPAVGRACYQEGEVHRLRGEFEQAEAMYREAGRNGCEPQPGMSLLRLAEGKPQAAAAAIRGVIQPGGPPGPATGVSRGRLLGPSVEIAIAAGDLETARAAADELAGTAAAFDAPFLRAASAQATGAVLSEEGEKKAALGFMREAWMIWQQLELPYESARARVLVGRLCKQLGDLETARLHFDAARCVLERLGAAPDLSELERLTATRGGDPLGALTGREREVLARVAAGETNRQVAAALGISEHTVARHLSNIFGKIGVATRTAAGAYAHRMGLLRGDT